MPFLEEALLVFGCTQFLFDAGQLLLLLEQPRGDNFQLIPSLVFLIHLVEHPCPHGLQITPIGLCGCPIGLHFLVEFHNPNFELFGEIELVEQFAMRFDQLSLEEADFFVGGEDTGI